MDKKLKKLAKKISRIHTENREGRAEDERGWQLSSVKKKSDNINKAEVELKSNVK